MSYATPESHLLRALARVVKQSPMTRYELARVSGVAESQLSRFMAGKSGLSIRSAEAIARALGYEVALRKANDDKS